MNTNLEDRKKSKESTFETPLIIFSISLLFLFCSIYFSPEAFQIQEAAEHECIEKIYEDLGYACLPFDFDSNPVYSILLNPNKSYSILSLIGIPKRRSTMTALPVNLKGEVSLFTLNNKYEKIESIFQKNVFHYDIECDLIETSCKEIPLASLQNPSNSHYYFVFSFYNIEKVRAAHLSEVNLFFLNQSRPFENYFKFLHYFLIFISLFPLLKISKLFIQDKSYESEYKALLVLGFVLMIPNKRHLLLSIFEDKDLINSTIYEFMNSAVLSIMLYHGMTYLKKLRTEIISKLFEYFWVIIITSILKIDSIYRIMPQYNYSLLIFFTKGLSYMSYVIFLSIYIILIKEIAKSLREKIIIQRDLIGFKFLLFYNLTSLVIIFTKLFSSNIQNRMILQTWIYYSYFFIYSTLKILEHDNIHGNTSKKIDQQFDDIKNV